MFKYFLQCRFIMKKLIKSLLLSVLIVSVGMFSLLEGADQRVKPAAQVATQEQIAILDDILRLCGKLQKEWDTSFSKDLIMDRIQSLTLVIKEQIIDDVDIIMSNHSAYQIVSGWDKDDSADKAWDRLRAAYRNLSCTVDVIKDQAHVVEVAQQAKALLQKASDKEKDSAISAALNSMQNALVTAKKSAERLAMSAKNMLKMSEDNMGKTIDILREIALYGSFFAAPTERKIAFSNENDSENFKNVQLRLSRLINSYYLDVTIRNVLMPDVQILLKSTNNKDEESKKAYERLRDTIYGVNNTGESLIATIKTGRSLVEHASIGSFQKAKNFLRRQVMNSVGLLSNAWGRFAKMSSVGPANWSGILTSFASKKKYDHILLICSYCRSLYTSLDRKKEINKQLKNKPQQADQYKKRQHENDQKAKKQIEKLMKDPILDEKTKQDMSADITIVLQSTKRTSSKLRDACDRLDRLAATYKPYYQKLMPTFTTTMIAVYGGILLTHLFNYYNAYHYARDRAIGYYGLLGKIVDIAYDAQQEGDMDKYHQVLGLIEAIGGVVTETDITYEVNFNSIFKK